jgi:hypothetical protein
MRELRNELWQDVLPALERGKAAAAMVGGQVASASAICFTMIGLPISRKPVLLQFDHQCAPEEATRELPFIALGSGQAIADPFLAFLREIFWKDKEPSIGDGVFAATWTLLHSIRTAPGGIAEPIEIAVLKKENGDLAGRILDPAELEEHRLSVAAAEEHLADYRSELSTEPGDDDIPDMPMR